MLAVLIAVAFYTDVRNCIIPNWLTFGGAAAGLAGAVLFNGLAGMIQAAIGMAAGFTLFLILYIARAVSAGDVKMFASIGSIAGSDVAFTCAVYSILYAGLIGIAILFYKKVILQKMEDLVRLFVHFVFFKDIRIILQGSSGKLTRFPFMYAVMPGFVTTWWTSLQQSGG